MVIVILLAVVFTVYGLMVLREIGKEGDFNFFFLNSGIGFFAAYLLKGLLYKLPSFMSIAICALCTWPYAYILVYYVIAKTVSFRRPSHAPKFILLLGCQVTDEGPGRDFEFRIKEAFELSERYPQAKVIASGGQVLSEPEAEAVCARRMLISMGLQEERIIAEDKSRSTRENMSNCRSIIGEAAEEKDVLIVTSDYHILRSLFLAKKMGFGAPQVCAARSKRITAPYNFAREAAGIIFELILG